jgi:hypothetical protein
VEPFFLRTKQTKHTKGHKEEIQVIYSFTELKKGCSLKSRLIPNFVLSKKIS